MESQKEREKATTSAARKYLNNTDKERVSKRRERDRTMENGIEIIIHILIEVIFDQIAFFPFYFFPSLSEKVSEERKVRKGESK